MNNQRRHMRLNHRAKIKLMVGDSSQVYILNMKDFSESGLFLLAPKEPMPPVDSIVEVQTTEIEDAPLQSARVVRLEEGVGFAVEFL
ncbi:MAG: PilZ domain-containing protein [Methylomonas sp.]